jgi:hypothetical protein
MAYLNKFKGIIQHKKATDNYIYLCSDIERFVFDWVVTKKDPKKVMNLLGMVKHPYKEEIKGFCTVEFFNKYEETIKHYIERYNEMMEELEENPTKIILPENDEDKKKLAEFSFYQASYDLISDWGCIYKFAR